MLTAGLDYTLLGTCHGGQEVCRRLLLGTDKAKAPKIRYRFAGFAKEYLPAMVEKYDFVEDLNRKKKKKK